MDNSKLSIRYMSPNRNRAYALPHSKLCYHLYGPVHIGSVQCSQKRTKSREILRSQSSRARRLEICFYSASEKLGEWCGLCKTDEEGETTKAVGCSCSVVTNLGEDTHAFNCLMELLWYMYRAPATSYRAARVPCSAPEWSL